MIFLTKVLQSRLIIDEFFLDYLFKDIEKAKNYLKKLQVIHSNSEQYQWSHNIILDKSFKTAIGKIKEIRRMGIILGTMHPVPFWDEEEGLHTSVIKQAISMASKPPFKVYVLTNNDNCENYNKNKHYNHEILKEAILIQHGQNALDVIDRLYSECQ